MTYSGKAVLGLEFLGVLDGIVYQAEAGGGAATVGGAETEHEDSVSVLDFVHL